MGASKSPFPSFPRGWFVIGFSPDIAPGDVKTLHYFGQDIVVFRTASGVLSAVDRTCPHLGAHLGVGKVDGECLRCPYHAWGYDATGRCVDIPYAAKIPPKAAVRAWPLREVNGCILVWHYPRGEAPTWEPPVLEEEGWTPNQTVRWELSGFVQDVAENTVDTAHLWPVHHVGPAEVRGLEQQGHYMHVVLRMTASGAPVEMPDETHEVELDVTVHGLGMVVSSTHVLNADLHTRQRIYPVPIDETKIAIFGVNNTMKMADPAYTKEIDDIFYRAFLVDFPRDFPIWSTKAYVDRPLLAAGDGPIAKYRKWCRQFYEWPAEAQPQAAKPQAAPEPEGLIGRLTRVARKLRDMAQKPAAPQAHGRADGRPADDDEQELVAPKPQHTEAPAAQHGRFASVESYFDTIEARFDREAAGDLEAVFQWVLTGDHGREHFVEIRGGRAQSTAGHHPAPTLTIEMSAADYLMMINGELNGARAFSTGRGKLRGPVRLAMKMQRLFPLERAV